MTVPPTHAVAPAWDADALEDLAAFAVENGTTGLVLLADGATVLESYRTPDEPLFGCAVLDDGRTREDVASAQKAVTALLAGMAADRGLLALDDPVAAHVGPGWSNAGHDVEPAITVRHLMSMTSGLDDRLTSIAPPGTVWHYNLGPAYHTVKRVVAAAAGTDIATLGHDWLFAPLGLTETAWEPRPIPDGVPAAARLMVAYPDGTPFEALLSTARDMAALGQALLDGTVDLTPARLAELWRPSTELNPGYGLLWWCNGQDRHLVPRSPDPVEGWLIPEAPADLVAALGAFARFLHVVPSQRLVVARLGGDPGDAPLALTRFGNRLWDRLTAARRAS